jgi:hypothetical protein
MDRKSDKDKKQVLLRLSPTLWKEIAAWAEEDFRSVNGQIEYLLTECVRRRKRSQSDGGKGLSDKKPPDKEPRHLS